MIDKSKYDEIVNKIQIAITNFNSDKKTYIDSNNKIILLLFKDKENASLNVLYMYFYDKNNNVYFNNHYYIHPTNINVTMGPIKAIIEKYYNYESN